MKQPPSSPLLEGCACDARNHAKSCLTIEAAFPLTSARLCRQNPFCPKQTQSKLERRSAPWTPCTALQRRDELALQTGRKTFISPSRQLRVLARSSAVDRLAPVRCMPDVIVVWQIGENKAAKPQGVDGSLVVVQHLAAGAE